ncbi:MAG TPA: GNAT family N-acetyltransferase [Chloroflexota bacterium]|nr:GNAT family N-acetyltransferase [Chloroflexota bacterium]
MFDPPSRYTSKSHTSIELILRPIAPDDLPFLLTWQYEPPYAIYSLGDGRTNPDILAEAADYFLDPVYRFYSMLDADSGKLTAVVSYGLDGQVPGGDYSEEALDIGFAVRPDLTGQGLGGDFVGAAINFAIYTFHPGKLRVTIADFNRRARRVWEKHGFQPVQTFHSDANDLAFTIFTRER